MLQLHRVFCATPWELEAERGRFDELIGKFNESRCTGLGLFFVPVSLVNIRDKRPSQYVIDENIRYCRHYIQIVTEDWGPVERNFRRDYYYALECADDPELPMKSVVLLAKLEKGAPPLAEVIPPRDAEFATRAQFDEIIDNLLAKWLEELLAA